MTSLFKRKKNLAPKNAEKVKKYITLKPVIVRDEKGKKLTKLPKDKILGITLTRRTRRKSCLAEEQHTAEIVTVNGKPFSGFCYMQDFRGNRLLEEIGANGDEKETDDEIQPLMVFARVPVFARECTEQQKLQLADGLERRHYKKDEYIIKEGDVSADFYILNTGRALCEKKDEKGEGEVLVAGDYFGEEGLMDIQNGVERPVSVKALKPTSCFVVPQKDLQKILSKDWMPSPSNERNAIIASKRKKSAPSAKNRKEEHPANEKTVDWIVNCVKDCLMFEALEPDHMRQVVRRMRLVKSMPLTEIIKQGDTKDIAFYVIKKGAFEVIISGKNVATYEQGRTFGQRALIQDAPRAATVKSVGYAECWAIDRDDYRNAVAETAQKSVDTTFGFVKSIEVFKGLDKATLNKVCESMELKKYKKGDVIIKQGDIGDNFYVIQNGTALMTKKDEKGRLLDTAELRMGRYFGELALMKAAKRAATISAKTDMVCLELSKNDFQMFLLPPLKGKFTKRFTNYMNPEDKIKLETQHIRLENLKTLGVLGKGAFGLVTLVEDPKTNTKFALKAIRKHDIVDHNQGEHIVNEKNIMLALHTPFCCKLWKTFKDKYRIYLLLEACTGGELFTLLRRKRMFKEEHARFYAACVIAAFDYMHNLNIVYRDLKPENLVIDTSGYAKLTDFGFAKEVIDKTSTVCGTPDYLAPEIIIGRGHGKGVDWWTLGILIYEMLNGVPPFYSKEDMKIYKRILREPVKFPKTFSREAKEIVYGLLRKRYTKRLGVVAGISIFDVPFFTKESANWSWDNFMKRKIPAPYPPTQVALKPKKKKYEPLPDVEVKEEHEWEKEF